MAPRVTRSVRASDGGADEERHRKCDRTPTELGCERQPAAEQLSCRYRAHHRLRRKEGDGVYDEQRADLARGATRVTSEILRGTWNREGWVGLGGVSRGARRNRAHANVRGPIRPGGARSG